MMDISLLFWICIRLSLMLSSDASNSKSSSSDCELSSHLSSWEPWISRDKDSYRYIPVGFDNCNWFSYFCALTCFWLSIFPILPPSWGIIDFDFQNTSRCFSEPLMWSITALVSSSFMELLILANSSWIERFCYFIWSNRMLWFCWSNSVDGFLGCLFYIWFYLLIINDANIFILYIWID